MMTQFGHLQEFLRDSLFIGGFIAGATLIAVQLLKPGVRMLVQRREIYKWLRRSGRFGDAIEYDIADSVHWLSDLPSLSELPPTKGIAPGYSQPGDLSIAGQPRRAIANQMLMRVLSNRADTVLEAPSRHLADFTVFTRYAPTEDRAAALYIDQIKRADPAIHSELTGLRAYEGEAPSSVATAIAALRESLSVAAERNLDELQLRLGTGWRFWGRIFAVGTALAIGLITGIVAGSISLRISLLLLVPLIAGVIALFAAAIISRAGNAPSYVARNRNRLVRVIVISVALAFFVLAMWWLAGLEPLRGSAATLAIVLVAATAGAAASLLYDFAKAILRRS